MISITNFKNNFLVNGTKIKIPIKSVKKPGIISKSNAAMLLKRLTLIHKFRALFWYKLMTPDLKV